MLTEATASISGGGATEWGGQYVQVLRNENGVFVDDTGESMFPQKLNEDKVAFPVALRLVDLNGEGAPDIVLQNRDTWSFDGHNADRRSVMMALNDGKGHFSRIDPARWGVSNYSGRYLAAADLDGDGDIDIAGIEELGEGDASNWHIYGLIGTIYENQGK